MKTIYVDSNYHCHVINDGTMTAVESEFFDDKCDAFIEGYCYNEDNGYVQIYPWKQYFKLDAAQREYEKQQLNELKNIQNELNTSYQEGINSI